MIKEIKRMIKEFKELKKEVWGYSYFKENMNSVVDRLTYLEAKIKGLEADADKDTNRYNMLLEYLELEEQEYSKLEYEEHTGSFGGFYIPGMGEKKAVKKIRLVKIKKNKKK